MTTAPDVSPRDLRERNARLIKLIEHLERGDKTVDTISLRVFRKETDCGTVGCLLGECPYLFPEDWRWKKNTERSKLPVLYGGGNAVAWGCPQEAACVFFGLTGQECRKLFFSGSFRFDSPDRLSDDTPLEELLSNVRAFLAEKGIECPSTKAS